MRMNKVATLPLFLGGMNNGHIFINVGYSAGVQRTNKKIRKAIQQQEEMEKQEQLLNIQDGLRRESNNSYNE